MTADPTNPIPAPAGFRDVGPVVVNGPGLVGHLVVLGVLLIVQAVLEMLFGIMLIGSGAMFYLVPDLSKMMGPAFGAIFAAAGGGMVLLAAVRLAAGVATLRGQGRKFAIVALLLGLATVTTTYCAPTCMALAIYGLWILVNEAVIEAYRLAQQGKSWAEVRRHFGLT